MTQESFTTIILKPAEGHYLTNAGEVDIKQRVICSTIALGRNDKAENYVEIDEETAEAYKEAQKKAFEEERENKEV